MGETIESNSNQPDESYIKARKVQEDLNLGDEFNVTGSAEVELAEVFPELFGITDFDNVPVAFVAGSFVEAMKPIYQGLQDNGYKFVGFNPSKLNLTWFWEKDRQKFEMILPLDKIKPYGNPPKKWLDFMDNQTKIFFKKISARSKAKSFTENTRDNSVTLPTTEELLERFEEQSLEEDTEMQEIIADRHQKEDEFQISLQEAFPDVYEQLSKLEFIDDKPPGDGPKNLEELRGIINDQLDLIIGDEPEAKEAIESLRNALWEVQENLPSLLKEKEGFTRNFVEILKKSDVENIVKYWDKDSKKYKGLLLAMEYVKPVVSYGIFLADR